MMKDNKFDEINEALDTSIESSITEIQKDAVPISKKDTNDVGKDYEYTRANLYSLVEKGQELELGDSVGKIGNTGRSTGKHLHYEIKLNDKARNPQPFLRIGKNVSKKY